LRGASSWEGRTAKKSTFLFFFLTIWCIYMANYALYIT
jgi:hypothetical protein